MKATAVGPLSGLKSLDSIQNRRLDHGEAKSVRGNLQGPKLIKGDTYTVIVPKGRSTVSREAVFEGSEILREDLHQYCFRGNYVVNDGNGLYFRAEKINVDKRIPPEEYEAQLAWLVKGQMYNVSQSGFQGTLMFGNWDLSDEGYPVLYFEGGAKVNIERGKAVLMRS